MINLKKLIKEIAVENPNARYCGILLSEKSRSELLKMLYSKIPTGWKVIAHHMTIDPFKLCADSKYCNISEFNSSKSLKVTHYGISDKACAVKVNYPANETRNKIPHVTIAINETGGGKAKDSNSITNWVALDHPINISGTLTNL
jgi:hypothetical protein